MKKAWSALILLNLAFCSVAAWSAPSESEKIARIETEFSVLGRHEKARRYGFIAHRTLTGVGAITSGILMYQVDARDPASTLLPAGVIGYGAYSLATGLISLFFFFTERA